MDMILAPPLTSYITHKLVVKIKSGFLNLSTGDIWTYSFFWWGVCPVPCRMLCSTPSIYPLDNSSNPLVGMAKHVSMHCQMSLGGQLVPIWESLNEMI